MAHLDSKYHYRVYDGEDKPLKLEHRETALEYAIEHNAKKVALYLSKWSQMDAVDVSDILAQQWLDDQPEVPAILPDFIKRHLPPKAIELKRNQQLGRV